MADETSHLPDRPEGDAESALESAACHLEELRAQEERLRLAAEKFSEDARKETSSRGRKKLAT